MLVRRGRFITPLSRGALRRFTYAYVGLYVLQVVDTAIAQSLVRELGKGHQRERKLFKGEEAARDRELVLDSAYECTVNVASSSL